jgi:CHAT domain-containing protein/lipopolysaccharide biosynthesis regulator YciM
MPSRTLIKSRVSRAVILCVVTACAFQLAAARVVAQDSNSTHEDAAEQLVRGLVSAGSAEERRALLASAPAEAVNGSLRATLTARGVAERTGKRLAQAAACFEAARSVAEFLRDEKGEAEALNELAETSVMQGEFERAVEFVERARALDPRAVGPIRLAEILFIAGSVHFYRGDYERAMGLYRRSLEAYERGGNKAQVSSTLSGIGAIHYLKGEYAVATEIHRRSLKLAEESGDLTAIAFAKFSLGADYRMQGDYATALRYYEQSLSLNEQLADEEARRGGVTRSPGREARENATVLRHIGTTHLLQGNYPLALRYFERVLRLDEEARDELGLAYSLGYMGGAYRAQGRYDEALDHLERSLRLFEKMEVRDGVARTLATLGGVYQLRGDSERALAYFRRSLELRERMDAKEGVAVSLLGVATAHASRGEYAPALEVAERAAALARRIGSPHVLWGALLVAGRAHFALGHVGEARRAFDESISTVESLRAHVAGGEEGQELFFADKLAPYHEVLGMLVREGRGAEAFRYAEAGKGRVLLDVLRAGRERGRLTAAEATRDDELRRVMNNLSGALRREQAAPTPPGSRAGELQGRLEQARLEYSAFRASLYASHPEMRVESGEARPVTPEDVAGLLSDEETAIAEYVVTEQRTYLFVFTKRAGVAGSSLTTHSIDITRTELSRRAEEFRRRLAQGDLLFSRNARELYDLLLGPAEGELKGKRRLIIVPDDKLWELPFQALQTGGGGYLIERSAVTYAPSLTVLREMMRRRESRERAPRRPATLLAFGNPLLGDSTADGARGVFMHGGDALNSLPEAERQVRALAALYGPRRSRVYTRGEAREERVKREAGHYGVLHLATHGTLDDASPMYSNVVLAHDPRRKGAEKSSGEDGLLEAWELMEMRLDAELVVLSACETARGRVTPGEGLIGLSWALFVAGSPTTVVSQWKVESASTTKLMLDFHRHLQVRFSRPGGAGGVTKADALRLAALRLLRSERYAHPFYWAGFVMIGDGN